MFPCIQALTILSSLGMSAPYPPDPYAIDWYTIDCGGGTSSAGALVLSGTIGQWDAGPASGPMTDGRTTVTGGFWVGATVPSCNADFNGDGELNADDLGDFINCYFSLPPCSRADFNADGEFNADDLGDYINAYFSGC